MVQQIAYSIGIDVDKRTFKTCIVLRSDSGSIQVKASSSFNNKLEGFKEFIKWINKHIKNASSCFVMESTGVYHEHLAYFLYNQESVVHIILPTKAKYYNQSIGLRSKNDKIDAKGLAIMGMQQDLDKWQPCSKELYALRSITRQLEMLQETRTVFLNQLEAASHSAFVDKIVIKNLKSLIKQIDKNIATIKKHIEELIKKDFVLKAKYELVASIKGMGIITFAVLVAETGGFELFKNQKQLVCYSGYDVVENQSGKRVGKTKISKKGNSHIRRILHMASLNMVRYEVTIFKNMYERIYERTRIKMKGYVAVQRKLLCLVYTLWKRNEAFNPMYQFNSLEQEPKPSFSVGSEGTVIA